MRPLFDQNLAPRLVHDLADLYPDSAHVRDIGLKSSTDREIWDFARDQGYVIVSKDTDFQQMSFVWGHPPKVIWIRRGNCSVRESESNSSNELGANPWLRDRRGRFVPRALVMATSDN